MIKVIYEPKGTEISDFKIEEFANSHLREYQKCEKESGWLYVIHCSNELILDIFELKVLKGEIKRDEIKFYILEEELEFHPTIGLMEPIHFIGVRARLHEEIASTVKKNLKRNTEAAIEEKKRKEATV